MVAAELGMSTEQVNQAKARFAQALLNAVRRAGRPERQGRKIMPELEILRKAITAINDSAALERLRDCAPQVRDALEEQDLELGPAEFSALADHPEWIARVYAALGENEGGQAEVNELQSDMAAILTDEQEVIADAWAALLDKLDEARAPAGPGSWEKALQAAGHPDPELVQHLRDYHPSCRKGDPAAERLLQYGLSPGMLFEALRGMELLFNRALRRPSGTPPRTQASGFIVKDGVKKAVVSQDSVNFDLAGTLDLEQVLVSPLACSLRCMLEASPFLVNGYQYLGENNFLKLPEMEGQDGFLSREELVRRWCADTRELGHTVAL